MVPGVPSEAPRVVEVFRALEVPKVNQFLKYQHVALRHWPYISFPNIHLFKLKTKINKKIT